MSNLNNINEYFGMNQLITQTLQNSEEENKVKILLKGDLMVLPTEVIFSIFEYLSKSDLYSVCKINSFYESIALRILKKTTIEQIDVFHSFLKTNLHITLVNQFNTFNDLHKYINTTDINDKIKKSKNIIELKQALISEKNEIFYLLVDVFKCIFPSVSLETNESDIHSLTGFIHQQDEDNLKFIRIKKFCFYDYILNIEEFDKLDLPKEFKNLFKLVFMIRLNDINIIFDENDLNEFSNLILNIKPINYNLIDKVFDVNFRNKKFFLDFFCNKFENFPKLSKNSSLKGFLNALKYCVKNEKNKDIQVKIKLLK
ncbi:MAG: F-box protein, partial [Parachlamydiaceae bacterium]|nr:F-box protein [Parachlamydiaceae bacterium]